VVVSKVSLKTQCVCAISSGRIVPNVHRRAY
jgi:hypothetical protein